MATPTMLTSILLFFFFFTIPLTRSLSFLSARTATEHCNGTLYPDLCVSTLTAIPYRGSPKSLPDIISSAIGHTESTVNSTAAGLRRMRRSRIALDARQRLALADCLELLDETVTDLDRATADLARHASSNLDDLRTVLSAAITNQYTCLDGFSHVDHNRSIRPLIQNEMFNISHLVSNSLAMAKKIPPKNESRSNQVFDGYGTIVKGFPKWLSAEDQALLLADGTTADLVVAKDGTGHFTTVADAVAAAPNKSAKRFVIYIKQGAYFENIEVVKHKTNLMFIGDGIEKTLIKASRNVVDGWTTYSSATVAVVGNGFLARDLTIENGAGPSKHQAVALRSNSDLSAFYRCRFVGYQDTLYVHSQRQFYRECEVYGTVDFVFGNAAVVLQKCSLFARRPDPKQKNIFTAQGREDPNENTGISIQQCKLAAAADLVPVQAEFKTYLGRPWKMYSRTVIMQSNIGGLVDPAGWLEWDGDFALSTLYYGEYMNTGAGSSTKDRVKWPGYRVIGSATEAERFTVGSFIQGDQWLAQTTFPFIGGLAAS
ncbi:pectinesterase precursor [Iris pallida]|uniref:Pectinesterase n=1 Tax=Iris pallida TaxID=29817 RepID=A0AAX6DUT6_IRIPA|nr:pectinesterase precursor [Iris pallida]